MSINLREDLAMLPEDLARNPINVPLIWAEIQQEIREALAVEPALASYYQATILNHARFSDAIAYHLANLLATPSLGAMTLQALFEEALQTETHLEKSMMRDIRAHRERDPACDKLYIPFLFFKGFQALSSWRIAHWLWQQGRRPLALFLQHQISQVFAVDIHPGAVIGAGIMIDHATGVVIGETAIIDDNVSMLHAVTLGGSGATRARRHPHIKQGVLIGAGAKLLGNIVVGEGAKIGAGSVVLESVDTHTTVAGVPAKPIGRPRVAEPARDMNHNLDDPILDL